MKPTLQTKILAGLMAAFALLLVITVFAWHTTKKLIEDAEWTEHTQEVMTRLATLLSTVTDAETGVRGYVITGDAEFLEPYRQALAHLDQESLALRRLTADNPRRQQQLDTLAPLLAARMANIRAAIILRQERGFAAAQELTASGAGKKIHDAIRTVIAAMRQEEERLLAERNHRADVTARTALLVIAAGGLVMLLLTGAMLLIIIRGFAARTRAEQERDRLFNFSLDMYCIAGFDGYFKQVNPAWHKTLGWSDAELLGRPFLEFVHPDDREATTHAVATLVDGQEIYSFDNRYRCKDGSYKWLSWVSHPLHEDQLIFAAARDITERKQQDEALLAANEALRLATENAQASDRAKSEFLANMSHELRTPLNAIIGFSEMMKDGIAGELTPVQQDYVGDIFDSGVHLLSLINDILDLSKVEAGKMELVTEPLQAGSLLRDTLTIVKEKALKHRIALDLDLAGAPATFTADARKVKQIVYNLLSNAVKFTPDGGQVRISARTVGREAVRLEAPQGVALRQLPLPDNAWQEFVEIKVCDTGIGIAAANLDRLFQPFTQLDSSLARNYEGTGLGLALVRRMTDLHGGTAAVASAEGKGSCFAVWLPLRNEAPASEAPAMQPGESQPGETRPEEIRPAPAEAAPARHALVIEDDSYAAELLRHHLQGAGFTVVWAPNAVRGLELAASAPPDLITLDLLLPGMGGWEALRIIKANPALTKVPVVIVSMVASKNTGLALGAAKVLLKPVLRAELLGALRELGLGSKERRKFTVLAVDDDPKALKLIAAHLATEKGCTLLTAGGGQAAIDKVRQAPPDLLILDLMMPGISGFDVVDALKADPATAALPILILTAKNVSEAERKRLSGNVLKIMEKSRFDQDSFLAEVRRALAGGIGNET